MPKLSANLKYTATGELSTPRMWRPFLPPFRSYLAAFSQHLCLLVPGCRQLGQAVGRGVAARRGFSAEHGTTAGRAPSQGRWHGWLASQASPMQTWATGFQELSKTSYIYRLTNRIYPCNTWNGGNLELACGLGISPGFLPRSKNSIEMKTASRAPAICEVFSPWRTSCWLYLWPQLQLGCARTACLASILLLKPSASTVLLSGLSVYFRDIWGQKAVKINKTTREKLRWIFQEAICAETAMTETRHWRQRAKGKAALCLVRRSYC